MWLRSLVQLPRGRIVNSWKTRRKVTLQGLVRRLFSSIVESTLLTKTRTARKVARRTRRCESFPPHRALAAGVDVGTRVQFEHRPPISIFKQLPLVFFDVSDSTTTISTILATISFCMVTPSKLAYFESTHLRHLLLLPQELDMVFRDTVTTKLVILVSARWTSIPAFKIFASYILQGRTTSLDSLAIWRSRIVFRPLGQP